MRMIFDHCPPALFRKVPSADAFSDEEADERQLDSSWLAVHCHLPSLLKKEARRRKMRKNSPVLKPAV